MDLVVDPNIWWHVLVPITLVMVLVHVLRGEIARWMAAPQQRIVARAKVRETHHLLRLRTLAVGAGVANASICSSEHAARRAALQRTYTGASLDALLDPSPPAPILDTLMPQAQAMVANYLPQPLLLWFVQRFFSGYVVARLPFRLTANFKEMLHSSIAAADMDVEYVTGVSWFFANAAAAEVLANAAGGLLSSLGGLLQSSFLDSAPEHRLRLENAQNAHNLLVAGGPSEMGAGPIAPPQLPGTNVSRSAPFETLLVSARATPHTSVLDGVRERFLANFT